MRFRAEQHLHRPGEIRAVREQGQRVECRAFTLWWKRRGGSLIDASPAGATSPSPSGSPSACARVCVIASTAAVGNAVCRNRAKRRLREIFRSQQTSVPQDCDLLLIARRAALEWRMPELTTKFAEACQRIGNHRRSE